MSNSKRSETTSEAKPSATKSPSTGFQQQLQERIDAENAQGFRGTATDTTPDENYTVAGVTSGAPTPETDPATAKKVRDESGLGLSPLESAARDNAAMEANAANSRKQKRGDK